MALSVYLTKYRIAIGEVALRAVELYTSTVVSIRFSQIETPDLSGWLHIS